MESSICLLFPHPADDRSPSRAQLQVLRVLLSASVAVLLCSNLIGPGKTVVLHAPGIGGISFGAGNIFFPISYIRRRLHGGLRVRASPKGHLGRLRRDGFRCLDERRRHSSAGDPNEPIQSRVATGDRSSLRQHVADHRSIARCVLGRRLRELLRPGRDEADDRRPLSLDADDRIDGRRTARRLGDIVPALVSSASGKSTTIVQIVIHNWLFKVFVEIALTPVTYWVVNRLKRSEREYFDRGTNFNPFTVEVIAVMPVGSFGVCGSRGYRRSISPLASITVPDLRGLLQALRANPVAPCVITASEPPRMSAAPTKARTPSFSPNTKPPKSTATSGSRRVSVEA